MSNCCGGLSIEKWRDIMQFHPYFFYQLANTSNMKITAACNQLVREYDWMMADTVGRADIRRAIDTAVEKLTDELDYSPYPRYFEEVHSLNYHMFRGRGCAIVRLNLGKVIDFGVEDFELLTTPNISAGPQANGGWGINDNWVATFDGSTFDLEEAYAYPANGDLPILKRTTQLDPDPKCQFLIPLVRWTLDNSDPDQPLVNVWGEALGRAVKPILYDNPTQAGTQELDPATADNFISLPRLYRRYTNSNGVTIPTAAVLFEFDNACGCAGCGCNGQGLPYTRLGQATNWDARTGEVVVYPATFNAETEVWTPSMFCGCHLPDRVRVRYYAGDDDACKWDTIVARLAAAELARPICACTTANRELARWQFDLARSAGANDEQYVLSPNDLDNPLGTRRGQVYAYKDVLRLGLVRAVAL